MKKIFILLSICIASFGVKAQGNLQFNQIVTQNGTLSCGQTSPTFTVPNGKVWKIESFSPTYCTMTDIGPIGTSININGLPILNAANFYNNSSIEFAKPIWLKANDSVSFTFHNYPASSSNGPCYGEWYNFFISIMEFNIVSE